MTDSTISTIIIAIIAAIPTTIASIAGLIVSLGNRHHVKALKITVDGRLTELLAVTKAAALAQGTAEGIESERVRQPHFKDVI